MKRETKLSFLWRNAEPSVDNESSAARQRGLWGNVLGVILCMCAEYNVSAGSKEEVILV